MKETESLWMSWHELWRSPRAPRAFCPCFGGSKLFRIKALGYRATGAIPSPQPRSGPKKGFLMWEMYARAVEFAFPMRQLELRNYGEHIRGLFSRTTQSAHRNILGYDIAVRKLIGSQRGLLFDDYREEQVTNLYQSYLDVNGGQYVKEATADASASGGNGLGGRRSDKKSREICRNFNFGACLGRCDRLHVCNLCRGPHTAKSDECIGNTPAGKKNTVNR